jgi:hypothetical protein
MNYKKLKEILEFIAELGHILVNNLLINYYKNIFQG